MFLFPCQFDFHLKYIVRARNFVFSKISVTKGQGMVREICLVKMCSAFVTYLESALLSY